MRNVIVLEDNKEINSILTNISTEAGEPTCETTMQLT